MKRKSVFGSVLTAVTGLVAGGALLIGCQTVKTAPERGSEPINTRSVLPVPSERAVEGTSGLLLAYEFQNSKPDTRYSECRMRLEDQATGKNVFITLHPNQDASFTALNPGHYRVQRMGCGIGRIYDLKDLYGDGFRVFANQVSYIGKLIFIFDGRSLQEVKKAGRLESAQAFSSARESIDAGSGPVVSGFTGEAITPDMAEGDLRDGFDVFIEGVEDAQSTLQPLLNELMTCSNAASKIDSLRFGRLEYVASYVKGSFSSFKLQENQNALAPEFRSCIESSMRNFQVSGRRDAEVRVRF